MNRNDLQSLIDEFPGRGDQPAILAMKEEGIESWSYRDLSDSIRHMTQGLIKAGMNQGDRIALFSGNSPAWISACLGGIYAGAVMVPIDVQMPDEILTHALADSEAGFIFTTLEELDRLDHLDLETKPEPVLLEPGPDHERGWRRAPAGKVRALPKINPEDTAIMFYTSGTTGPPKGVPLTHGNISFQLNTLIEAEFLLTGDRVFLPLPLHHVYPLVIGLLVPLAAGLTIILPYSLTGPQIIRGLGEGKATIMVGVPRLFSAFFSGLESGAASRGLVPSALFKAGLALSTFLRRHFGLRPGRILLPGLHRHIGPTLRVLASGGSALDPELAFKLEGLGWQIAIGYGLTETSPLLTLDPPGKARIGSVGRPVHGIELRLDPAALPEGSEDASGSADQVPPSSPAKEEGKPSMAWRQGEILARGPGVFSGYYHLPEKTREAFTQNGWFRTGDLGYFDDEGYLYLTGRLDTLMVTEGGKNVQPEEIEKAYLESPVISEIGVLQKGGRLVAVIIPEVPEIRRRGEADFRQAVYKAVAERSKHLPTYQRISDFAVIRVPLPRTRLGKIRRHLLPDLYDQGKRGREKSVRGMARPMAPDQMSPPDRALLDNPAARQVWNRLAERYPDHELTPDSSPQLDLGIDSLEWVNLTMDFREKAGVELSEEAIGRIDRIRDLLAEVVRISEAGEALYQAPSLDEPEQALSQRQKKWLKPLGPIGSIMARGMYTFNRALIRALFRLQVKGMEYIPDSGQLVITPNHTSYLDAFVVAAALGNSRLRETYWSGWTGVAFQNPINRLVSRLAQIVPIDPAQAVLSSLAFGASVLKRQKSLIWFPEGYRSPTGQLQPFKPGIGLLLDHFSVPVVPVFIHGSFEAMPPGRILPRLRPITIIFGRPIDPDQLKKEGEGVDSPHRMVKALHDHVSVLGRPAA
ncbi:MAG: AMP-binding protein [bacterium]